MQTITITTGLYEGLEGLVLSEHPGICAYVRLGDSYRSKLGDICVDWQDYLRARKSPVRLEYQRDGKPQR